MSFHATTSPRTGGRPRRPVDAREAATEDKPGPEGDVATLSLERVDSTDEEENETLMEELAVIREQNEYYDFVEKIARDKEPAVDEDGEDPEYEDADQDHPQQEEGDDDASTSSSLSYDECLEEEQPLDELDACPVPAEVLLQAHKRFPPFWRTQHGLRNVGETTTDEEADPDYVPEDSVDVEPTSLLDPTGSYGPRHIKPPTPEAEADEASMDSSSEGEAEALVIPPEELQALEAERASGLASEVDLVADRIQELSLPSGAAAMAEDDPSESLAKPSTLVEAISEFDPEGYCSDEDPDFAPSVQEMEAADYSPEEVSSESETEDSDNGGEAMDQ